MNDVPRLAPMARAPKSNKRVFSFARVSELWTTYGIQGLRHHPFYDVAVAVFVLCCGTHRPQVPFQAVNRTTGRRGTVYMGLTTAGQGKTVRATQGRAFA